MIETYLTEVDVKRRLLSAGQSEIPVVNSLLGDELDELFSRAGHSTSLALRFRLAS